MPRIDRLHINLQLKICLFCDFLAFCLLFFSVSLFTFFRAYKVNVTCHNFGTSVAYDDDVIIVGQKSRLLNFSNNKNNNYRDKVMEAALTNSFKDNDKQVLSDKLTAGD